MMAFFITYEVNWKFTRNQKFIFFLFFYHHKYNKGVAVSQMNCQLHKRVFSILFLAFYIKQNDKQVTNLEILELETKYM